MNWPDMNSRAIFIALFISSSLLFGQGIRSKVEEGNVLYKQEKYEQALARYQDALLDEPLNEAALFNRGNALYKLKKYDESIESYQKVVGSKDLLLSSKALYNIGNVYFQQNKLQESIQSYKKALELNPNDYDIKYNLELARAKLKELSEKKQMPNQNQQQKPVQPSEFAKQLKERAEKLVEQRKYAEAHQLMINGLKKDQTVAAFQDFIQRIKDVIDILG